MTGRVRTEAAAGSNDVKRAIGAFHCSALPSKFCRFASVISDFTDESLLASAVTTVKRVAKLMVREQIAKTITADQNREAMVAWQRDCSKLTTLFSGISGLYMVKAANLEDKRFLISH